MSKKLENFLFRSRSESSSSCSQERINELKSIQTVNVKEITSKFQGSSVVETQEFFQKKLRQLSESDRALMKAIYNLKNLHSNPSKPNNKSLDFDEKLESLNHWSTSKQTEQPTKKISFTDAITALSNNGISPDSVSSEQWEEWKLAIINVIKESPTKIKKEDSIHSNNDSILGNSIIVEPEFQLDVASQEIFLSQEIADNEIEPEAFGGNNLQEATVGNLPTEIKIETENIISQEIELNLFNLKKEDSNKNLDSISFDKKENQECDNYSIMINPSATPYQDQISEDKTDISDDDEDIDTNDIVTQLFQGTPNILKDNKDSSFLSKIDPDTDLIHLDSSNSANDIEEIIFTPEKLEFSAIDPQLNSPSIIKQIEPLLKIPIDEAILSSNHKNVSLKIFKPIEVEDIEPIDLQKPANYSENDNSSDIILPKSSSPFIITSLSLLLSFLIVILVFVSYFTGLIPASSITIQLPSPVLVSSPTISSPLSIYAINQSIEIETSNSELIPAKNPFEEFRSSENHDVNSSIYRVDPDTINYHDSRTNETCIETKEIKESENTSIELIEAANNISHLQTVSTNLPIDQASVDQASNSLIQIIPKNIQNQTQKIKMQISIVLQRHSPTWMKPINTVVDKINILFKKAISFLPFPFFKKNPSKIIINHP